MPAGREYRPGFYDINSYTYYLYIAESHKYSTQSCCVLDKVKALLYDIQFDEVKRDYRYLWLQGLCKYNSTLKVRSGNGL